MEHNFDQTLVWDNTNNHWNSFFHDGSGKPVSHKGYNAPLRSGRCCDGV